MIAVDGLAKAFAAPRSARNAVAVEPASWWSRRKQPSPEVSALSRSKFLSSSSVAASASAASASASASEPAPEQPSAPPSARRRGEPIDRDERLVKAVRDVTFTAPNGCITGLLGPNGAGKTTTLRMLAGLIAPDAGTMVVDGIDVVRRPRDALACMGVLSDARGLYPRLSARENIVYYGVLQGLSRDAAHARAESLAEMLDLKPLLERRTDGFSQGERMKTALARALVHDPANIVLDEPTNGLDVLATRALRDSLRWLRTPAGGSKCIVFSTHVMQEVARLCDHVVVVAEGRTVATGTPSALMAQTGEADFEDAFVRLAFGPVDESRAPRAPAVSEQPSWHA